MIPILPPTPRSDRHIIELVGVSRVLAVPTEHLPVALAALDIQEPVGVGRAGRLELEGPFEPGPAPGYWRARARLHLRGLRLVPYARVEVDVSPWSHQTSDVHVRPVARSPHAWGVRRLRRYLTLAPLATAELVRRIEAQRPASPTALVHRPAQPLDHDRRAAA